MSKFYFTLVALLLVSGMSAQQKIRVHNSGNTLFAKEITSVDSIKLDNTFAKFKLSADPNVLNLQKAVIDSLTFTTNNVVLDKIYIIYNGADNATIINPYATQGINITANAGTVVVNAASGIANLEYNILGATDNGSLTLTSDTDVQLVLNNLTLTNPSGAAFDILGGHTANIVLSAGTTNTLKDGATSTRNGTITTDGPITISNTGSLVIYGLVKHGINTSSNITVANGNITIASAVTDGLHSEGYLMNGGTVTITSLGDGIDAGNGLMAIHAGTLNVTSTSADVKALKTGTNVINIDGGTFNLNVSGAQSKAVSAKGDINISGGIFTVTISGAAVLVAEGSGFNPSYATAFKTDANINISNGTFNVTLAATANGAKGFSGTTGINISGGNFTVSAAGGAATYTNASGLADAYSVTGFTSDAAISVDGGTFNLTISGAGGKGISADTLVNIGNVSTGPNMTIINTASRFLVSGTNNAATANYVAPKCIKGTTGVNISNGQLTLSVANQNSVCIDSDATINVNSGAIGCTVGGNQSKALKSVGDMNLGGGTINITATGGVALETSGSGNIPSYCAGLKSDTNINLAGTNVTITGTGAAFKGVSANNINVTGGTVSVTSSGAGATYTNATGAIDSYSSAAFSADTSLNILGGSVTTNCSGNGGKGLNSDGTITIGSDTGNPTLNIRTTGNRFTVSGSNYNHPKTVAGVGAVTINNGSITINSSDDGIHSDATVIVNGGNTIVNATSTTQGMGEGVEAPIIRFNGGVTNITSSNDGINATYGTVAGGTESNDNSHLYITGGIVIVAGSDAIDSNGNITITGGTTIVNGPTNSPEEGMDFNGTFLMNGGLLISGGSNSNMTKAMANTSTQVSMYIKSSGQLAATSLLHIRDAAGNEVLTFKPKNAVYYFHFSRPELTQNTGYNIYFGGSYTGGSYVGGTTTWGLYTGGSYSLTGATLKKTFTSSASATVNTVTF
ncbi:MAG: carbohydrate-binding domain-containing protein [Flavobacteriaceae bacterium]